MSKFEGNQVIANLFSNSVKSIITSYNVDNETYNKFQIDNIIYDYRSRIVTKFKENLIWNEPTELLRR